MGIPNNYSLELPNRCLDLLDGLWEKVSDDDRLGSGHGGPLTTTFLVSLAIPIVVVPTERILKQDPRIEGAVDDWHVDRDLADRLRLSFLNEDNFGTCPFFNHKDGWSYSGYDKHHNFARGLPDDVGHRLQELEARDAAGSLPAKSAILAVRNALAHGSIAYLNQNGSGCYGGRAEKIALISERRNGTGEVVGYHILCISEIGFRSFLRRWVKWLNDSGVAKAMVA